MKLKMIRMGKEARSKLQEGINLVADIIKTTLGPKGRNVIVSKLGPLPPRSMNDGYYIADHIQSEDPIVNAGVEMVKEICKKTNDVAGDGPQPKHSKVLTPTGFKKLGDIKIGDKICGTNGTIQEVLGVFEKGKKRPKNMITTMQTSQNTLFTTEGN